MALPALWPQFDALADVPVMVIRGLLSDLLSAQTVAMMRERHPSLEIVEIADEGHPMAPLLNPDGLTGGIIYYDQLIFRISRQ